VQRELEEKDNLAALQEHCIHFQISSPRIGYYPEGKIINQNKHLV